MGVRETWEKPACRSGAYGSGPDPHLFHLFMYLLYPTNSFRKCDTNAYPGSCPEQAWGQSVDQDLAIGELTGLWGKWSCRQTSGRLEVVRAGMGDAEAEWLATGGELPGVPREAWQGGSGREGGVVSKGPGGCT